MEKEKYEWIWRSAISVNIGGNWSIEIVRWEISDSHWGTDISGSRFISNMVI